MPPATAPADDPGARTLVVGLGRTGLSCVRYLAARGVTCAVTDSRRRPPELEALLRELPDTALFLGRFDPAAFAAARSLVVSPGVPLQEPLIQDALARGIPVLGDIELFGREAAAPVAAITGSNGKSTVTSLLGEMARRAGRRAGVGGNLGRPALELLDEAPELYILELSSFQLETTRTLETRTAVVLNLSADHMDRYPDLETYARAKGRIYRGAQLPVVNLDDPAAAALAPASGPRLGFTLGPPAEDTFGLLRAGTEVWIGRGRERLLAAAELRIPGRHNLSNALAALALGTALELPLPPMLEALRRFPGLPHRTQFLGLYAGARWYNDSKGTNPGACVAALEGLGAGPEGGRTVLIAGGDAKGADFSGMKPAVQRRVRALVLMGRDADVMERALGGEVPVLRARNLDHAVRLAAGEALPGDQVLLSPACASFDMFRDYAHRGEAFVQAVERLFR